MLQYVTTLSVTFYKYLNIPNFCFPKATPQQMIVTWSVPDKTDQNFVVYGLNGKTTEQTTANVTIRVDEGKSKNTQYMCTAWLNNLEPGQTYSKFVIYYLIV